jgi:hypothetical protein
VYFVVLGQPLAYAAKIPAIWENNGVGAIFQLFTSILRQ